MMEDSLSLAHAVGLADNNGTIYADGTSRQMAL